METYENKYKEALEAIKKLQEANPNDEGIQNWVNDNFPELAESEDEKIRKEIIGIIRNAYWTSNRDRFNKLVVWLEKQESVEEIVERCKDSWYNEGKIAGMAEGLTDDEKYQQGWHDAIEKQGEQNSAWSNGYSNGYIQAIEKACEWLYQRQAVDLEVSDIDKFVKEFKKAMKGGNE